MSGHVLYFPFSGKYYDYEPNPQHIFVTCTQALVSQSCNLLTYNLFWTWPGCHWRSERQLQVRNFLLPIINWEDFSSPVWRANKEHPGVRANQGILPHQGFVKKRTASRWRSTDLNLDSFHCYVNDESHPKPSPQNKQIAGRCVTMVCWPAFVLWFLTWSWTFLSSAATSQTSDCRFWRMIAAQKMNE